MKEISMTKADYRAFIVSSIIMIIIALTRFFNFGL